MLNINKQYKKLFLTIIVWILSHNAYAENILTLQEAILMAKKENVDIRIREYDLKFHALSNKISNATPFLPTFNYTAKQDLTYSFNDECLYLHADPKIIGTWSWSFQAITERIFSLKINKKQFFIENLEQKKFIKKTLKDVVMAYYDVALAQKKYELTNTAMHLADVRMKQNTEKFKVGLISRLDYIESKLQLEQAKFHRLKLEKELKEKRQILNLILNKPLNAETKVETTIPKKPICQLIENNGGKSINLDLAIQEKKIEKAVAELNKTKCKLLAFINLDFNCPLFLRTYNINTDTFTSETLEPYQDGITARISIHFDIARLLLIPTKIRRKKIKLIQEKLVLSKQKTILQSAIEQQRNRYHYIKDTYKVKAEHLKFSKQKLDLVKEYYHIQQNTLLQLLEAEEKVKQEELQLIECAFNVRREEFLLDELLGKF